MMDRLMNSLFYLFLFSWKEWVTLGIRTTDTIHDDQNSDVSSLPNSCIGKEDGIYWLHLSRKSIDCTPIQLQCSNEYVILDKNKSPKLIDYFNTFEERQDWFVNKNIEYLWSPDCNVCDESDRLKPSQMAVNYEPSVITNGEFCICYKPSKLEYFPLTDKQSQIIQNFYAFADSINDKQHRNSNVFGKNNENNKNNKNDKHSAKTEPNELDKRATNKIFLSQSDFEHGTYRITQSGTYIITEDIIFNNFNIDEDYIYYSYHSYHSIPSMASAGISVESNYVTINLNGKELKQSLDFYYQQTRFAIISIIDLTNDNNNNVQGLRGASQHRVKPTADALHDISIIDGTLGLTSHAGIHGNNPINFMIDNVRIKDFVAHGVQLNGWKNIYLNNVEIGPGSRMQYLKGDYGHAKLLQRQLRAAETNLTKDGTIDSTFFEINGRGRKNSGIYGKHGKHSKHYKHNTHSNDKLTITDIADELDLQMLLAFDYAMNRAQGGLYEESDYISPNYYLNNDIYTPERWQEAKTTFIHESGLPSAGAIGGMLLSESKVKDTIATHKSNNGVLNNIYIHDIAHEMIETVRLSTMYGDIGIEAAVGGIDKLEEIRKILDSSESDGVIASKLSKYGYVGNVVTDAYFAMEMVGEEKELEANSDDLFEWLRGTGVLSKDWLQLMECNKDAMGESARGLIGLRIDGASNLEVNNVIVDSLIERSPLGTRVCGDFYDIFESGASGGNSLQGVSVVASKEVELGNIMINNLRNDNWAAFGISFWTDNDINDVNDNRNDIDIKDNAMIIINDIMAGIELEKEMFGYFDKANSSPPEACAMRVGNVFEGNRVGIDINVNMKENGIRNIFACDVMGHEHCLGGNKKSEKEENEENEENENGYDSDGNEWSMFGNYYENGLCEHLYFTDSDESAEWGHYVMKNKHIPDEKHDLAELLDYMSDLSVKGRDTDTPTREYFRNIKDIANMDNIEYNIENIKERMKDQVSALRNGGSQEFNATFFEFSGVAGVTLIGLIVVICVCCHHLLCRTNSYCNHMYKTMFDEISYRDGNSSYGYYLGNSDYIDPETETYLSSDEPIALYGTV